MKKLAWVAILGLSSLPASATLLFDNFPINGTTGSLVINEGEAVSDSFFAPGGAQAIGVNFGAWLLPGDSLSFVDWIISTDILGSGTIVGSGTAPVFLVHDFGVNLDSFDVQSVTFSFPAVTLPTTGTYYLTLQNAVASNFDLAAWDENNGPGIDVWQSTPDGTTHWSLACGGPTCAESFQILGAPEPGTLGVVASALLLIGAGLRRRRQRVQ